MMKKSYEIWLEKATKLEEERAWIDKLMKE